MPYRTDELEATDRVVYPDGHVAQSRSPAGDINMMPEGEQISADADTTGVKLTGTSERTIHRPVVDGAGKVNLVAKTLSGNTDPETVTVELVDSSNAVVDSMDIVGGGQNSKDVLSSLTGGESYTVRFNVTATSDDTDATFTPMFALLEIV